MKRLEDLISTYEDFPKKGIFFKDLIKFSKSLMFLEPNIKYVLKSDY